MAKDRLVVAEQRRVDAEQRKSTSLLQLLAFKRKQFEKRLGLAPSSDLPARMPARSISDSNLHPSHALHDLSDVRHSSRNFVSFTKLDDEQQRSSDSSNGDLSERLVLHSDEEDDDDDHLQARKTKTVRFQSPLIAITAPDDDAGLGTD